MMQRGEEASADVDDDDKKRTKKKDGNKRGQVGRLTNKAK